MFYAPFLRLYAVWTRFVPCAFIVVALLPVGWMAAQIATTTRDIAYWDEIDSALALLLRLDSGMGTGEFFRNLFAVTNEHRTVTSRLIFAASYWLTGSIDFAWLGVIGNGFLLAAGAALIAATRGTARRLQLAVPLALLLFQLENYESFFWSGSSIDHFQVVALAVAAVVALARDTRAGVGAAAIAATLATFTLAQGLVVWPVGALMLVRERRWRALAAWGTVAALAVTGFFIGFSINPGHRFAEFSAAGAFAVFHYWLTLLGAPLALGHLALAPWLGAGLLLVTLWRSLVADWPAQRVLLPVAWFVLGATALIALGRAEVSHGQVYSRYMILGGLGWALTIFAGLERWSSPARPFALLAGCVPLLATFNLAANATYREDAETFVEHRDRAALRFQQYGEDGKGPVSLHPVPARATAVLAEAARRNLYRLPRMCERREFPDAKPSSRISYFVDEFNLSKRGVVYLSGWAAVADEISLPGELHLVLRSAKEFLVFSTVPERRLDVVSAFHEPRWRMAGFRFLAGAWRIPPGEYQVGFLIGDTDDAEYILTDHRLKLVGKGKALLAQSQ